MAKKKSVSVSMIAGCGNKLVRFSYPALFEPKAMENGPLKYSVMLLIDKDDQATISAFQDAMKQCIAEALAAGMWGGQIPPDLRKPLRDGDTDPTHKDDPVYAGKYFVNASSTYKPGVVNRNNQEIINPDEVYPGCWGRAQINLFPYDSMGNRGIGVGLNNIQKVMDGENLSGRPDPRTVFAGFDNSAYNDADDFAVAVGVAADDFAVVDTYDPRAVQDDILPY